MSSRDASGQGGSRARGSRDEPSLDALFEAARRERPSTDARRRTLERVARAPRRAWGGRWLGLAAAAALVALVLLVRPERSELTISAELPRRAPPSAEQPPPARAGPPAPAAPEPRPEPSLDAPRVEPASPTPSRAAVPPKPTPRSPRTPQATSAPAAPTLEAELALLDRARAELAAGKPLAAQASLDAYAALGGGELALEARLLRIQALADGGERASASALAQQFIEQHPDSPLAERARAFVDPGH
jgi:hypothetical protein